MTTGGDMANSVRAALAALLAHEAFEPLGIVTPSKWRVLNVTVKELEAARAALAQESTPTEVYVEYDRSPDAAPAADLVQRLREEAERWGPHHKVLHDIVREAADAIEVQEQTIVDLRAKIARLRHRPSPSLHHQKSTRMETLT